MGFRDRFYTPATARAILSWRIAVGVGVTAAMVAAGVNVIGSALAGVGVYAGLVFGAMPRSPRRPRVDPFAVGEPWRHYVTGAQRAVSRLRTTVSSTPDGPLHDRMAAIQAKVDHGLDETWRIARRGDELDEAVKRLDPTALRSRRDTLRARLEQSSDEDDAASTEQALASVESQLETTERLKRRSEETAATLQLTQARLDELAARAVEVSVGSSDTESYEHDVEELVDELEGLRLAIEETGGS